MEPFAKRNPPSRSPKKDMIVMRTTPEEFDIIDQAAQDREMNRSEFIRFCIAEQLKKE